MPLEVTEPSSYRQVVRIFGTNVKGERPLYLALCGISGIGRRFAHAVARRAGLDPLRRAGTITADEETRLCTIIQNPAEHGIPVWMLNRCFDRATGKDLHWVGSDVQSNLRNEIERLKKMKTWRGLRHNRGLKVRGQCTKSTGRRGVAVGVERKK
jgi:ribosomal protein S13